MWIHNPETTESDQLIGSGTPASNQAPEGPVSLPFGLYKLRDWWNNTTGTNFIEG
jgi:hypothetical protein